MTIFGHFCPKIQNRKEKERGMEEGRVEGQGRIGR